MLCFWHPRYCVANACHYNGFSVGVKTGPDLHFGKITLVIARGPLKESWWGERGHAATVLVQMRWRWSKLKWRFATGLGNILEAELPWSLEAS